VDTSGTVTEDVLVMPIFHTASVPYLAYFATYSLIGAGASPYFIGANGGDRGMEILHSGGTRQIRPVSVRTGGTAVANGSALTLSQQYIITQTANRARLKAYINNSLNLDLAETNTDFQMPVGNYLLGQRGSAPSLLSDFAISEFVAYARDVEAEISGINTNTNTFYGAY
jgi:hypothetical protein